jgi:hypothetical protein
MTKELGVDGRLQFESVQRHGRYETSDGGDLRDSGAASGSNAAVRAPSGTAGIESMVMAVGFLMFGDSLVALNLVILPAGRTERRAPRIL